MAVMQFEIVCVQDQLQRFSFNFVQKKNLIAQKILSSSVHVYVYIPRLASRSLLVLLELAALSLPRGESA